MISLASAGPARVPIDDALAEINVLRAFRDGMTDQLLKLFPRSRVGDVRDDPGATSILPPRSSRFDALRGVERRLNGFSPGEEPKKNRGARGRLLNATDTSRFLGKEDRFIRELIAADEIRYLERRRAELVFEDTTLDHREQADLLRGLVRHEADNWKRWGEEVSPLLEYFIRALHAARIAGADLGSFQAPHRPHDRRGGVPRGRRAAAGDARRGRRAPFPRRDPRRARRPHAAAARARGLQLRAVEPEG